MEYYPIANIRFCGGEGGESPCTSDSACSPAPWPYLPPPGSYLSPIHVYIPWIDPTRVAINPGQVPLEAIKEIDKLAVLLQEAAEQRGLTQVASNLGKVGFMLSAGQITYDIIFDGGAGLDSAVAQGAGMITAALIEIIGGPVTVAALSGILVTIVTQDMWTAAQAAYNQLPNQLDVLERALVCGQFPYVTTAGSNFCDFIWNNNISYPPIVIDLNSNGFELSRTGLPAHRIPGHADSNDPELGWVSKNEAFLAFDRNNDRQITIDEINFVTGNPHAETDMDGLYAYDTNHDGVINQADNHFERFSVWQDHNMDTVAQPSEVSIGQESGIDYISLDIQNPQRNTFIYGQQIHRYGTVRINGKEFRYADVELRSTERPSLASMLGRVL